MFDEWNVQFLIDYIVNIHHAYLQKMLPLTKILLREFVIGHIHKYPYLTELESKFTVLFLKIIPHLEQEEEIVFPYIKQIASAYNGKEAYGDLLVRTLRKPIEVIVENDKEFIQIFLLKFRELTQRYFLPQDACILHQVVILKLRELDADLVQHVRLENEILFPKALLMEREILSRRFGP